MTYRAKAGLLARILAIVPDNDTEEVSPQDVRELMVDIVESYQQGVEPLPPFWGRGYEQGGTGETIAERQAVLTPDWVRQGTRVEGAVTMDLPYSGGTGWVVFYIPTSWLPLPPNLPAVVGALQTGQVWPVLNVGLVGNVGYSVICSPIRYVGFFIGANWRIRY